MWVPKWNPKRTVVSRISHVIYTAIFQNGSRESHVIVSNSNDKGKDTMFTFVKI